MNIFMIRRTLRELRHIVIHSCGGLSAQDRERGRTALPEGAAAKARLWLVVMAATAGLALYLGSWLPVLLLGPVPTMIGGPIKQLFAVSRMSGWPATCSTTGSIRGPSISGRCSASST